MTASIYDGATRPAFKGTRQNEFAAWPTPLDLFPAAGGGVPGLIYLLVATEHSADYIGQRDPAEDEDAADYVARWSMPRGRQAPIIINEVPVTVLARGKPLSTIVQGQAISPVYVDSRLPKAVGLPNGPTASPGESAAVQPSGALAPKAPAKRGS